MRRDTRQRFEQYARNPSCEANMRSAILGVRMATVASREGMEVTSGQSPFAIARGETFERRLFKDEAIVLRTALAKVGAFASEAAMFVDHRIKRHGGPWKNLDQARDATLETLRQAAAGTLGDTSAPLIIAGAALLLPGTVLLPDAMLVVDVLVLFRRDKGREAVVGEVKTYPYRAGHTDGRELAGARAQAGTYIHALRLVLDDAGLAATLRVSERGFLVLTKPGTGYPAVVWDEDLRYQAARAARGIEQLSKRAAELPVLQSDDDKVAAVCASSVSWSESCPSFCERAPVCYRRALDAGDPAVLGQDVARFVNQTPLPRVVSLLGRKAKPRDKAEEDLLLRLKGSAP